LANGARRRFGIPRGAYGGAILVALLSFFALVVPLFLRYDPWFSDFEHGRRADGGPVGPNTLHWLGTDTAYRDQLARLAEGARTSLVIGISASALSVLIGAVVGMIAGYSYGKAARLGPLRLSLDGFIMRTLDVGQCFPFLLLVMALGALLDETSVTTIFLVLGSTSWLGTARVVRAKTLEIASRDFVIASRALGQRPWLMIFRHVLPGVRGTLIVLGTLSVAQMILAESALGYLNLGLAPPFPTWGHMLLEGQRDFGSSPWLLAAPSVCIVTAVLGFNLLGEGLRDALEPKGRGA
jgi:ABC-type dipeptide/oligopeptide/nickel transport system permease subunit